MFPDEFSRRSWLKLAAVWPEVLAAQQHAATSTESNRRLEYLDAATAAEIEAIAAQIIPTTDTPGAREAGVIYFIDRALSTFAQDQREAYRTGLAGAQAKRKEMFPGSASIASLSAGQQIALLEAIEDRPFFGLVRFHAILGFFGPPSRGGNRGQAGWKLIGFEDAGHFQPPFGYYDRETRS